MDTSRWDRCGAPDTSAPISSADRGVTLVASTEPWETIEALTPEAAAEAEEARRRGLLRAAAAPDDGALIPELVLAADQFIITPAGRAEEAARARAAGEEVRTVIAGYHWFTDWGRDTMISLEGLTLSTHRYREAKYILRTFAHYVRDGLIPNMFPDGAREGLYHTADATLWFFHAVERYVRATGDTETLERLLPTFADIVRQHIAGTRFGIGVDPADGLLRQGEAGYQLTWMDAKVDDWVVTPRRGQGRGDQRALVQRAPPARGLDEGVRRGGRPRSDGLRRPRVPSRSIGASGARSTAISTTSWTGRTATMRRAGRTRCSPSRSIIRCSIDRAGSR